MNIATVFEQALSLHRAGDFTRAAKLYESVLLQHPRHPDALHFLGILLDQTGKTETGLSFLRQAVQAEPTNSNYRQSLAIAQARFGYQLCQQQRWSQAVEAFQNALEFFPANAQLLNDLGNVYQELGLFETAIATYRQALRLSPKMAIAADNLGHAYAQIHDFSKAIEFHRQACQLEPENANFLNRLAAVFILQGNLNEARNTLERLIVIAPNHLEAGYNLGHVLQRLGKLDLAIERYRQCLKLQPDFQAAANALLFLQQQVCDWRDLDVLANRILESFESGDSRKVGGLITPFSFLAFPIPTNNRQQAECARRWTQYHFRKPAEKIPSRCQAHGKIRLGYISGDLQEHAVAYAMLGVFKAHDRSRFLVHAYSYGQDDQGPTRSLIIQSVDSFRDVADWNDQETIATIQRDQIDILIDLQGHTKGARTGILASRAAPIQVSYLGFAGSMGAEFIDAILADQFVLPTSAQADYTEKIIHLPGCFFPLIPPELSSRTGPTREQYGLPKEAFVFGALHGSHKISKTMFEIWLDLLQQNPASILWLPAMNMIATENLRAYASSKGIREDRLCFSPRVPSRAEHLSRYSLIDLFLDTFPYNAHSTAADVLMSGVPLLTLSGETFVSRVSGSILRHLGLEELITLDQDDYRRRAMELAACPVELSGLRNRLQNSLQTDIQFSADSHARKLEQAYIKLAKSHNSL